VWELRTPSEGCAQYAIDTGRAGSIEQGMGAVGVRLRVVDYQDPDHWRWLLQDPDGNFVADHQVVLDRAAPEYQGFVDLARFLRGRWRQALALERAKPASGPLAQLSSSPSLTWLDAWHNLSTGRD